MKSLLYRCLWFLLSLLTGVGAHASPDYQVEYAFYDIFPENQYAIAAELNSRSPVIIDGQRFRGSTHWEVEWHYQWRDNKLSEEVHFKSNNRCLLTDTQVKLKAIVTMPRLARSFAYSADVKNTFNRYYEALLLHENEHVHSGLMAATEIDQELQALSGFESCEKLKTAVDQTANAIIAKYDDRDKRIDRVTDHGRTTGVTLALSSSPDLKTHH